MEMKTLDQMLKEHAFFKDLKPDYLNLMTGCASNVRFKEGEVVFREGDPADKFYLIREGRVAIDVSVGQYRSVTIQTVQDGDILGWSWLIPPHRARFQCRAVTDVRAFAFDGECLRNKCEQDHDLGYELLKRLTKVFADRLEHTRHQLVIQMETAG